MSIRFIQPDVNPYAGLFSLIGGIMGDNARQRQEQKSSEAMVSLLNPSSVDQNTGPKSELQIDPSLTKMTPYKPTPQFQMPTQQQPSLLSGAPTDMSYEGLVKQPNVPGTNALTMPQMQAPQTPQATVNTRQRGIKDVEKEIRQDYYGRLSQAVKEKKLTSADVARIRPEMERQMKADIEDARGQYQTKQQEEAYTAFETEQDPQKKIMIGMKAGLIGKEGAMMLIQPGTETKVINTGGSNVVVGYNKLSGKYVDLKDNSEIAPDRLQEMLQPTMTPGQQQAAYARENPIPRGGGDNPPVNSASVDKTQITNAKYAIAKHEDWVVKHTNKTTGELPDETKSPYHKYLASANQVLDGYYGLGGNEQTQSKQSNVNPSTVAQALATGKTVEDIAAFTGMSVDEIRSMAPAKQAVSPDQYTTYDNGVKTVNVGSKIADWWGNLTKNNPENPTPGIPYDPYYNR